MNPFEIVTICIGATSLIGAVGVPLLLFKGQHRLTEEQLDELDAQRRKEDEDRNRERVRADERRNDELRQQLNALSRMNAERFKQWQQATEDLDDLWTFIEDAMMPWVRGAYTDLRQSNPEFPPPPQLRRRHRKD
jgi:hypothetical protein